MLTTTPNEKKTNPAPQEKIAHSQCVQHGTSNSECQRLKIPLEQCLVVVERGKERRMFKATKASIEHIDCRSVARPEPKIAAKNNKEKTNEIVSDKNNRNNTPIQISTYNNNTLSISFRCLILIVRILDAARCERQTSES